MKKRKKIRIGVAVRVRPFLKHEVLQKMTDKIMKFDYKNQQIQVAVKKNKYNKIFKFDKIFTGEATQKSIFSDTKIDKMIDKVVKGFHATIFAYGQTGSGKTYTMEGYKYQLQKRGPPIPIIHKNEKNYGLIPRTINTLFKKIKESGDNHKRVYKVYCSYLQIYNERIFDLLNPTGKQGQEGLRLR